jgi:rhodanese-related sulfurtransferase
MLSRYINIKNSLGAVIILLSINLSSCDYFFPPLSGDKIDTEDAYNFLKKHRGDIDVVLLDVRTKDEYDSGHINNAVMVDFKRTDFPDEIAKLDRNKRYIIYSNSAVRSSMAFELMKEMRFEKVHVIKGGLVEWKAKNLPMTF